MGFRDRLAHAWNAFKANETKRDFSYTTSMTTGMSSSSRLDRTPLRIGTERTILASIYSRIAIDVAAIEIRHSRVDENGRFLEEITSNLNECLKVSANKDQTSRAFFMDAVLSMFDEGVIAIVPVDTDIDITKSTSYDIRSMRTGRITQWYPDAVQIDLYNDNKGIREEITLPKDRVCIIENPFYEVMNKPNSTLQRLRHKLALLDHLDDKQHSDKLNMIIQLPYAIRNQTKRDMAEERRKEIEVQLTDNKYGIAYVDGTEKIIQLGHSIESDLPEQIEKLTSQLYNQMGAPETVFDGTADEKTMLNYYSRTVEPIVSAIVDEMHRKFLTKTARTQGQAITFFREPFALVPIGDLADVADKFTRNEIVSSNEFRAILGYKPVNTERANELVNKNINPVNPGENNIDPSMAYDENYQNEEVSPLDDSIDVNNMTPDELEAYLAQLEAFDDELNDLESQVDDYER